MAPKATIFVAISAIFLFASPSAHSAPENSGHAASFGYAGAIGPNNWSHLSPSFSLCSHGKVQSPINILKSQVVLNKNLKPLTTNYGPANATLVVSGHHVEVEFEAGVLAIDGKNYSLKQMHWHTPSEHLIDGIQYPAELHMVHKTDDGSTAVVGILYKLGASDPLLSSLHEGLKGLTKDKKAEEASQVALGNKSFTLIDGIVRSYYRYIGSLTTPPCTENIVWSILTQVRSISPEQVEALQEPLKPQNKHNCRPVQHLNGRRVEVSEPHDDLFYFYNHAKPTN